VSASNRGYVYEFFGQNPPPLLGLGLGNANIYFSDLAGSELVSSFLSLYLTTMYAAGVPGFVLLVLFLAWPVLRMRTSRAASRNREHAATLMGYLAYLAAFALAPEELTVPFGIVAALLTYREVNQPGTERAGEPARVEMMAGG
jgi:hypothetical protein